MVTVEEVILNTELFRKFVILISVHLFQYRIPSKLDLKSLEILSFINCLCFTSNIMMKHSVEYVCLFWYFQYMLLNSGCSANRMTHKATCDRIQGNGE